MVFNSYKREVLEEYDKTFKNYYSHQPDQNIKRAYNDLRNHITSYDKIFEIFFTQYEKEKKEYDELIHSFNESDPVNGVVNTLESGYSSPKFDPFAIGSLLFYIVQTCVEISTGSNIDLRPFGEIKIEFQKMIKSIEALKPLFNVQKHGDLSNLVQQFNNKQWEEKTKIFRKVSETPMDFVGNLLSEIEYYLSLYCQKNPPISAGVSLAEMIASKHRRSGEDAIIGMIVLQLNSDLRIKTGKPLHNVVAEIMKAICYVDFSEDDIKVMISKSKNQAFFR